MEPFVLGLWGWEVKLQTSSIHPPKSTMHPSPSCTLPRGRTLWDDKGLFPFGLLLDLTTGRPREGIRGWEENELGIFILLVPSVPRSQGTVLTQSEGWPPNMSREY